MLALLETLRSNCTKMSLSGYTVLHQSSGGVGSLTFSEIDLSSVLQAVAARISLGKTATVCMCIYLGRCPSGEPTYTTFLNCFLAHVFFCGILTVTTLFGGVAIVIVEVVSLRRFVIVVA